MCISFGGGRLLGVNKEHALYSGKRTVRNGGRFDGPELADFGLTLHRRRAVLFVNATRREKKKGAKHKLTVKTFPAHFQHFTRVGKVHALFSFFFPVYLPFFLHVKRFTSIEIVKAMKERPICI
jgi:hypothetical protein